MNKLQPPNWEVFLFIHRKGIMPEQLQNILWMGEEMDFHLRPDDKEPVRASIQEFLNVVANPALSHWLYRANK